MTANALVLDHRERQRLPILEHPRRPAADLGHRNLPRFLCRSVGFDDVHGPIGLGAGDLGATVRVDGVDDGLDSTGEINETQEPSS
jgi:hypothetical protein